MQSRRTFIQIVPIAGAAALLAACGQKSEPASAPAAAAPAPAAAPPAPVAAAPAPAPAPAAAPAAPAPAPAAAAPAASGPMVDPADGQAVALGYKPNNGDVDKAKYPNKADGQACGNCTLFQGAAGADAGGCALFPGKRVSSKGWCSGYTKKA